MTAHAFINIVIPFDPTHSASVKSVLREHTDPGQGNRPAQVIDDVLTQTGIVHFMSMTVVDPTCPAEPPQSIPADARAHLAIEVSADVGLEEALAVLARELEQFLVMLLKAAELTAGQESLENYLLRHSVRIDASWGANALGQVFTGTPGMTVGRIRLERDLAVRIDQCVEQAQQDVDWHRRSPRQRLELLRDLLWHEGTWKWAFVPQPAPCLAGDPRNKWNPKRSISNPQVWKAGATAVHGLLWPLYLPVALIALTLLAVWRPGQGPEPLLMWAGALSGGLLAGLGIALMTLFDSRGSRLRSVVLAVLGFAAIALAIAALGAAFLPLPPVGAPAWSAETHLRLLAGLVVAVVAAFAAAYGWLRRLVLALAALAALAIVWRYREVVISALVTPESVWPRLWTQLIDVLRALTHRIETLVWLSAGLLAALGAGVSHFWLRLGFLASSALLLAWWHSAAIVQLLLSVHTIAALCAALLVALATFSGLSLARLRQLEKTDLVENVIPRPDRVEALMRLENFCAQNHLASVSRLKPGLLRRLTLRIAFIVVGTGRFVSAPGFLGKNGVIHFARWMRLPGTDQLLFWSNYDDTWQSYVGDFIADAPSGVTAIWSNCVGFPRTRALYGEGAHNRDRLVHWARRQQHPTTFWYSAYRELTAERIRINAAIRQGLASAESDADVRDWFALVFRSRPRPAEAPRSSQIPTLVYGGLSKLRCAELHAVTFRSSKPASADDRANWRQWLAQAAGSAAYGEMRPGQRSATVVAIAATGLDKLGLPQEAIKTFPVAFQQGMAAAWRARVLGDTGASSAAHWDWGAPNTDHQADALLLVYGQTPDDLEPIREQLVRAPSTAQHIRVHTLPLTPLLDRQTAAACGQAGHAREPFGFADGVSQPVIRGIARPGIDATANDVVAAGEFLLGYPDNLGRIPPSPSIVAGYDPDHLLPDATAELDPSKIPPEFSRYEGSGNRDLGPNGTFLVVRQLEQNVAELESWLDGTLERIEGGVVPVVVATDGTRTAIEWGMANQNDLVATPLPRPRSNRLPVNWENPAVRRRIKDAIAAKLVGRWKDGTSLVRHPLLPGGEREPPVPPDNDFLFGADDPSALACPFGAHVRRANPRDTRFPGSSEEIATTNRHRILRVGRIYGTRHPDEPCVLSPSEPQGLLFMCLNADIERQFEFIQKTWLLNPNFHGLENENDPLLGYDGNAARKFSIPTPTGVVELEIPSGLRFVTLKGGGYFFLPGRAALQYLAAGKY
jgi:deferrochelatase/peroxidase EfeB